MKLLRSIGFILSFWVFLPCFAQAQKKLQIKDYETLEPLSGAEIKYGTDSGIADENGAYILPASVTGKFTVHVTGFYDKIFASPQELNATGEVLLMAIDTEKSVSIQGHLALDQIFDKVKDKAKDNYINTDQALEYSFINRILDNNGDTTFEFTKPICLFNKHNYAPLAYDAWISDTFFTEHHLNKYNTALANAYANAYSFIGSDRTNNLKMLIPDMSYLSEHNKLIEYTDRDSTPIYKILIYSKEPYLIKRPGFGRFMYSRSLKNRLDTTQFYSMVYYEIDQKTFAITRYEQFAFAISKADYQKIKTISNMDSLRNSEELSLVHQKYYYLVNAHFQKSDAHDHKYLLKSCDIYDNYILPHYTANKAPDKIYYCGYRYQKPLNYMVSTKALSPFYPDKFIKEKIVKRLD